MKYAEMSLDEQNTFKEWLGGLLRDEIVTITFTKRNGDLRVMKATQNERLIANKNGLGQIVNNEIVCVTDVELDEWRSIRYDSIKEIQFDLKN